MQFAKHFAFLIALVIALPIPVFAATPTTATAFTKAYTTLKMTPAMDVSVIILTPGEDEVSSIGAVRAGDLTALLKKIRAATTLPAKPTVAFVNGDSIIGWKKAITATALKNIFAAALPIVKKTGHDAATIKTLSQPIKNVSAATLNVWLDAASLSPVTLSLDWQTSVKKNNVVTKSHYRVIIHTLGASSVTPSPVLVPTPAPIELPTASSTSNTTKPGAMDVSGAGGVSVYHSPEAIAFGSGRDAARLEDLKAFQTALEMFSNDQGFYPPGSKLVLGTSTTSCLDSDGFAPENDCPYPYMARIPADPGAFNYVYTREGTGYSVTARLEGAVQGLSGNIVLTPNGIYRK